MQAALAPRPVTAVGFARVFSRPEDSDSAIDTLPWSLDSDDEDEDIQSSQTQDLPEEELYPADNQDSDGPGSRVPLQQPPPVLPQPFFGFENIMCWSGRNSDSLFQVIQDEDALLPPGPIIVHS